MSDRVIIEKLPPCQFPVGDGDCPEKAEYDFKTANGPWAYGCAAHFKKHRFFDKLGTGRGQKLVVE